MTNTIYVAKQGCFLDDSCSNRGSVTVINGTTNSVTTIIDPKASNPTGLALDATTDKMYVANVGGNVTVIDGGATPTTHILSLLLPGNGSGTVTSSPAGIDCTLSCTASFVAGTVVDLTALPSSGATFSGWSTNCPGIGACNVTMISDEFVTASFTSNSVPDFSLQPASVSLTAQRGSQVTDVITIAPLNGSSFGSAIQLSCAVTGSTPTATCALSPTSIAPGANPATSTLTVTTPTQSARLIPAGEDRLSHLLYAVFLPMPLALLGFGPTSGKSKRRGRQLWLLCSLIFVFVVLQAGCGGGSSVQQTQAQNYTVTVTANSGAIQRTAQVTVTVP